MSESEIGLLLGIVIGTTLAIILSIGFSDNGDNRILDGKMFELGNKIYKCKEVK